MHVRKFCQKISFFEIHSLWTVKKCTKDLPSLPREKLKIRRTLKGHVAKIYAIQWATNRNHLISSAQDGNLIIWDGKAAFLAPLVQNFSQIHSPVFPKSNSIFSLSVLSTNKTHAIPTKSQWMMTCAFAPSAQFVASGGLDNICSVYNLQSKEFPITASQELVGHDGYISCCRFLDDQQIVTSSGDNSCILWDIDTGKTAKNMNGHHGAASCVEVQPSDKNVIISGSSDSTTKLWDLRASKSQHTYKIQSGVNGLQ